MVATASIINIIVIINSPRLDTDTCVDVPRALWRVNLPFHFQLSAPAFWSCIRPELSCISCQLLSHQSRMFEKLRMQKV